MPTIREQPVTVSHVSLASWDQRIEYLRKQLLPLVNKNSVVLDAGCGKRNVLISPNTIKKLVGCDIDTKSVDANRDIDEGFFADLETTPLPENAFDLVMTCDVI